MVVSMLQFIIELPDVITIKDKRRIVKSVKEKIQRRFKVSIAEVDLQDSLRYTQIAAAIVSNSRSYGEEVMNKIIAFIEKEAEGRLQDVSIHSELF